MSLSPIKDETRTVTRPLIRLLLKHVFPFSMILLLSTSFLSSISPLFILKEDQRDEWERTNRRKMCLTDHWERKYTTHHKERPVCLSPRFVLLNLYNREEINNARQTERGHTGRSFLWVVLRFYNRNEWAFPLNKTLREPASLYFSFTESVAKESKGPANSVLLRGPTFPSQRLHYRSHVVPGFKALREEQQR